MEQTFATIELMQAASHYMPQAEPQNSPQIPQDAQALTFEKEKDELIIFDDHSRICTIDLNKGRIQINEGGSANTGIYCSFFNPYSLKSRFKQSCIRHLRGDIGKYILGIGEIKHILNGIDGPTSVNHPIIIPFGSFIRDHSLTISKDNVATIQWIARYHQITMKLKACKTKDTYHIYIDPVLIEVLDHDLQCHQVLFPVVNKKAEHWTEHDIEFEDFTIKGNFSQIHSNETLTAVDITLASNWTHGGTYKTTLEIIIPFEINK